jgi:hypothetical protein
MSWFCPEDFEINEKSREFAKAKGMTDSQIQDALEAMKDHEYPKKRTEWNMAFRNWIRRGMEWGQIVPAHKPRKVEEVTDEQLQKDREDWAKDIRERFGIVK